MNNVLLDPYDCSRTKRKCYLETCRDCGSNFETTQTNHDDDLLNPEEVYFKDIDLRDRKDLRKELVF